MNRVLARKWLRKAAIVAAKAVGVYHPSKAAGLAVNPTDWIHLAARAGNKKFAETLASPFPSEPMADHQGLSLPSDPEWCFRWQVFDVPSSYVRGGHDWMTGCGIRRVELDENGHEPPFDVVALYSLQTNTLFHASRQDGDARRNNARLKIDRPAEPPLRAGIVVADGERVAPEVWSLAEELAGPQSWAPLVAGPFASVAAFASGQTDVLLIPPSLHQTELLRMALPVAEMAGASVVEHLGTGITILQAESIVDSQ